MSDELTVTVADLRAGVEVLLNEAERRLGSTINLGADYYWDLDARVVYDLTQVPPAGPGIGQLSDDVASLRSLLEGGPDGEVFLWHDLAHVVGILRRVATLDLPTTR